MNDSYLYAVTRWFDPAVTDGLRGVDGGLVRLVRYDDIAAVVSSLRHGNALQDRLSTLSGLEQVARAHHRVVDTVAEHTVTLPCRLATVHHDDRQVLDTISRDHQSLVRALDRLDGHVELGVKVYLDEPAAGSPAPPGMTSPTHPGRDYLRRRTAQRRRQEESWRYAAEVAARVDRTLSALAVDTVRHRPQPVQLPGAEAGNIFNAAYLVARELTGVFTLRATRAADARARVEVTGPWAPYSFAAAEQPRDQAGARREPA